MNQKVGKYYFIGIGGIGMSALAKYLFDLGNMVMGYDKIPSPITSQLMNHGISVVFDESVSVIPKEYQQEDTLIVYTPAVPEENRQLQYFIEQGNQVKKRAVVLGEIINTTTVFAIAGTHGKTTTASFLTHLFDHLNLEFTSFLGGIMNAYQSNLVQKGNRFSIVEADEYDHSFLQLSPDFACITSMDADHLDIYGNHDNMKKVFTQFSQLVTHKTVVAQGIDLGDFTYGISEDTSYGVKNICLSDQGYHFDLVTPKETFEDIYLNAIGQHNLSNAIGALAILDVAGFPLVDALPALESFAGIQRRMEVFCFGNKMVIDDYAHHPEEIKAVLKTVAEFYPDKKNMVVFQPHLFSRTQDFMEAFAQALDQFDEIVLMDIYPAREKPIAGVTSEALLERLKNQNKRKINKEAFQTTITTSEAELILVLGAGDIGNHLQELKRTA